MRSNVYRKLLTLDRIENYTFIRGWKGRKYFASAGERTLRVQKIGDVSIERSIARPLVIARESKRQLTLPSHRKYGIRDFDQRFPDAGMKNSST